MFSPYTATATAEMEIARLEAQIRALRGDDDGADRDALVAALRREQDGYRQRQREALEVGEQHFARPAGASPDEPRLTGNDLAKLLQDRIDAVDAEIVRLCEATLIESV